MKNFEKYIDKIAYGICKCDLLGKNRNCEECEFNSYGCGCDFSGIAKWLLAEYKEPIKLTHDEYVILKNLPSEYKWIVRHDNGENLWLFVNKPTKEGYCIWVDLEEYDDEQFDLFNHLFQFIKFEDEEPYEIAKLIADYEKENGDA